MAAKKGNKYALGNEGGRPPLYETPQDLHIKIEEYFQYIKGQKSTEVNEEGELEAWIRQPEKATITGLCLFLGFCSRSSFDDYEKKQEFTYIVKRAKLRVEQRYESELDGRSVTGQIFALKNMGWSDKLDIDSNNKNDNTNRNYNSEPMSPERIRAISDALEKEF